MKRTGQYAGQLLIMGYPPQPCSVNKITLQGVTAIAEQNLAKLQQTIKGIRIESLRVDDRVDLLLVGKAGKPSRIPMLVNALHETDLQLRYSNPDEPQVQALIEQFRKDLEKDFKGVRPRVLKEIRQISSQHLQTIISSFFSKADDAFFISAREAKNNLKQQQCFEALDQLHAKDTLISKRFIQTVLDQIERCEGYSDLMTQGLNREKLSVVDQSAMEDWLTLNSVIASVTERYSHPLGSLKQRYSLLMGVELTDQTLPVGIAMLCHAFYGAVSDLKVDRSLQTLLYRCFEEIAASALGSLYAELNACFVRYEILPELDVSKKSPARNKLVLQESAKLHGDNDIARAQSRQSPDMPSRVNPEQADSALAAEQSQKLYSTVRNLLALRRQTVQSGAAAITAVSDSRQPVLDSQQLLTTLNDREMESEAMNSVAAGVPLKSWISANYRRNGNTMQFGEEVGDQLELLENIFDSIVSESGVAEAAKPWLKQLEIPYLKVILQDENFLKQHSHPARELLNSLAELSSFTDLSPQAMERKLEGIAKQLTRKEGAPRELFEEALLSVKKMVENQRSAHSRNVERVARSYEGQDKLLHAHLAVKEALGKRLLGRPIPKIILTLLDVGWRDLLIQTYFKTGHESRQWREYLGTIDQLIIWLCDGDRAGEGASASHLLDRELEAQTFIELLGRELDACIPGQYKHVAVVKELQNILGREALDLAKVEKVELNPKDNWYGIELAGNERCRKKEKDEHLQRWCDRAVSLQVGDWIGSVQADHCTDMCLAWRSQDGSHMVFVNNLGKKIADLQLWEVAEKMKQGWQRVDREDDWAPVDRGLYTMLQKMYDELDFQRCHDELTGLINRKQFENVINRVLYISRKEESLHAMLHLNLDQFRVVNEYCGVVAGDQLLKEVSRLLQDAIPPQADIARLGGNEFAILLEGCAEDRAYEIAESLRRLVQDYRFDWQGKDYSLTASIGMVVIDQYSENFVSLFKDVNAACELAKEQGRNRIVWSRRCDEQRQKRDNVLSWVARINRALDQDRLKLRCQKISPVNLNSKGEMHYEVLLGVQEGDEDLLVPPDKFIEAAERYNRMHDVDRWVVTNAIDWMIEREKSSEILPTLSINLSGNTLNDDYFLGFITAQLARSPALPGKICFEVTETSTITNLAKAADFIHEVKKIGCKFALDDFGTGMSSYEYLKRLPVDYLKIDGCFITDIMSSTFDYAVVKSINEIGQFMGKKTVAEFVETEEIRQLLEEIGVDFVQGYGIEKPRLLSEI